MRKTAVKRSAGTRFLFLVYCALMLWLLFIWRMDGTELHISFQGSREGVNLVPLETVKLYLRLLRPGASEGLLRHAVVNLVGNVIMFVPLGWFLPAIWKKMQTFFKTFLLCAALICIVEGVQYITNLGSCDIDDLILNLAGATLGYILWRGFHRK